MTTNLVVSPLGSEVDLLVTDANESVVAAVAALEDSSVVLTVNDADSAVALTVVPDESAVSVSVTAVETPVSLTISVEDTVSIVVSELSALPEPLLSPTLTYNLDGTLATVTYVDGTYKVLTWEAGYMISVVRHSSGGAVLATRLLGYNGAGQLVSVVDT